VRNEREIRKEEDENPLLGQAITVDAL